ncbi:alpha-2-macroglobulin-like [Poecilia latipinna]|uniref:alpha-2-macroglobulin-like n=1 Tax=Poecilia latipinna TaxID=48699 RepID=UPI00072E93AC|nr:PREDICTED: alpha-2-macroglobulin-like [Poecilia latipinna]
MCRPFYDSTPKSQRKKPLCDIQTQKADKTGCNTFEFQMSIFTRGDRLELQHKLDVTATVEEEGTGTSLSQVKQIQISYVIGKLSFVDVPNVYDQDSVVEGKVKAVHYNDTPMSHQSLYLFRSTWTTLVHQELRTDIHGFASFSLRTYALKGDIFLYVSPLPSISYSTYKVPHILKASHTIRKSQPSSVTTTSSLNIKSKTILPCDKETEIFIEYTFVQESPGSVDFIYLMLSRGAIASQGQILVEVENKSVNEGEVSFKLNVSPDLAPEVQIMVYAVLPSKKVISQSTDFSTEKCFNHKVSLEFSSSSAVPGEETNLQLTAQPDSLCGVSAIDQSVLIKEPGKTLDAEKIFSLLPVRKVSKIPSDIVESTDCLPDMKKVGLKMATNLFTEFLCSKMLSKSVLQYAEISSRGLVLDEISLVPSNFQDKDVEGETEDILEPTKTVRTFFPESWIWDLVETG